MNILLILINLALFVFLIVGLIKPSFVLVWGVKKTRGKVFLIYISGSFLTFLLTGKGPGKTRNVPVPPSAEQHQAIPQQPPKSDQFLAKLKSKLPGKYSWDLEISKYEKTDVVIDLYYKTMPRNYSQTKIDTTLVARKSLEAMMELGVKPAEDLAFLFVHAYMREKGETGTNLLRAFGETHYDFNTDQLIWTPKK